MEHSQSQVEPKSTWELSKENIQPLSTGRKMACLTKSLETSELDSEAEMNDNIRAYEQAIRDYQGDDPLEPWIRLIDYIEQNCLSIGKFSKRYTSILSGCVRIFLYGQNQQNDKRFVDILIKSLSGFNPERSVVILRNALSSGVGSKISQMHIAISDQYEKLQQFHTAAEVLQNGIAEEAQPPEILEEALTNLQYRVAEFVSKNLQEGKDDTTNDSCVRLFGNSVPCGPTNEAPSIRVALSPANPSKSRPRSDVKKIPLFMDENAENTTTPAAAVPSNPIQQIDLIRNEKENELNPTRWNKPHTQMAPEVYQSKPCEKIQIYSDETVDIIPALNRTSSQRPALSEIKVDDPSPEGPKPENAEASVPVMPTASYPQLSKTLNEQTTLKAQINPPTPQLSKTMVEQTAFKTQATVPAAQLSKTLTDTTAPRTQDIASAPQPSKTFLERTASNVRITAPNTTTASALTSQTATSLPLIPPDSQVTQVSQDKVQVSRPALDCPQIPAIQPVVPVQLLPTQQSGNLKMKYKLDQLWQSGQEVSFEHLRAAEYLKRQLRKVKIPTENKTLPPEEADSDNVSKSKERVKELEAKVKLMETQYVEVIVENEKLSQEITRLKDTHAENIKRAIEETRIKITQDCQSDMIEKIRQKTEVFTLHREEKLRRLNLEDELTSLKEEYARLAIHDRSATAEVQRLKEQLEALQARPDDGNAKFEIFADASLLPPGNENNVPAGRAFDEQNKENLQEECAGAAAREEEKPKRQISGVLLPSISAEPQELVFEDYDYMETDETEVILKKNETDDFNISNLTRALNSYPRPLENSTPERRSDTSEHYGYRMPGIAPLEYGSSSSLHGGNVQTMGGYPRPNFNQSYHNGQNLSTIQETSKESRSSCTTSSSSSNRTTASTFSCTGNVTRSSSRYQ